MHTLLSPFLYNGLVIIGISPARYNEVYKPAAKAIQDFGLRRLVLDRTEPDLFIWVWEIGEVLK